MATLATMSGVCADSPCEVGSDPADALGRLRQYLAALPELRNGEQIATAAADLNDSLLRALPLPGQGHTRQRVDALMTVAAQDLCLVKMIEAHLDALAILDEAGHSPEMLHLSSMPLHAVWTARDKHAPLQITVQGNALILNGTLPFCTGALQAEQALLVASLDDAQILLYVHAHELPSIQFADWRARGMQRIPTGSFIFEQFRLPCERLIGADNYYLTRRGFWIGAIMVAACWLGGAMGIVRRWHKLQGARNDFAVVHLAASVALLEAARAHLYAAADRIDDVRATPAVLRALALSVRHVIEQAAQEVMLRIGRAVGSAPLIFDAALSTQLADLQIYVRQCHAEQDLAQFGQLLLADDASAWAPEWL